MLVRARTDIPWGSVDPGLMGSLGCRGRNYELDGPRYCHLPSMLTRCLSRGERPHGALIIENPRHRGSRGLGFAPKMLPTKVSP